MLLVSGSEHHAGSGSDETSHVMGSIFAPKAVASTKPHADKSGTEASHKKQNGAYNIHSFLSFHRGPESLWEYLTIVNLKFSLITLILL